MVFMPVHKLLLVEEAETTTEMEARPEAYETCPNPIGPNPQPLNPNNPKALPLNL